MLKALDKKFLMMASLIIFLPILVIILFSILQSCQNGSSSYESYEKKMKSAAIVYFNKNKLLPKRESETSVVSLSTLINKKLIKSSEKALRDSTCTGNVTARMNGVSLEKNEGGFINYTVNLKCKNYETNSLISLLKNNITQSESGLYYADGEYIFKGDKPKNYINFFDKSYRIMGITNDGLVRLIRAESETITRMWDNKYNSEVKFPYGKTIYKDSLLSQYLINDYFNNKKISLKARNHIVAHDVCTGKRKKANTAIDKSLDCSEILEKQLVSLLSVSDYSMASLDPDCNSIVSKSCNNYNYLLHVSPTSWTSNSVEDNTYEAFYLGNGGVNAINANDYNYYNIIIYIDGNEKVKSGTGSLDKPFVIK